MKLSIDFGKFKKKLEVEQEIMEEEFSLKLQEFRGNTETMWDKMGRDGGEGRILLSKLKKNEGKALKRWMDNAFEKFRESVNLLKSASAIIESNEELIEIIRVVEIHNEGIDWIIRDFYPKSEELSGVIEESDIAKENLGEAIRILKNIIKNQDQNLEINFIVQKILKRLTGKISANVHWDESSGMIIIIDMM